MTKLMDEAIDSRRRDVPPDYHDEIARVAMQLTGRDERVYRLIPDEKADFDEADAEIERGEFATDEAVRAVWAKHGL